MTDHPSTHNVFDYITKKFELRFIDNNSPLSEDTITIYVGSDLSQIFPSYTRIQMYPTTFFENSETLIRAVRINNSLEVRVIGTPKSVKEAINTIKNNYEEVSVRVNWVYNSRGENVRLGLSNDNTPRDEFYPKVTPNLAEYYERYIKSNSNILVLIGPPGTGKTSFIRGLLMHAKSDATISYDPGVLSDDDIFAEFISGKEDFMILEDADSFLSSRKKGGNTLMHKFLNVGDGLISTRGKKIVFSTNLPSTRDIDEALLRPGRCFDTLEFDRLTPGQARVIDPEYRGTESVTLAELLCGKSSKSQTRVGFV